jgi:hypothetical protein
VEVKNSNDDFFVWLFSIVSELNRKATLGNLTIEEWVL